MDRLKAYTVTKSSTDKTIEIGDIIWLSDNGDLNSIKGQGWLSEVEWDIDGTNDFEVEECTTHYLDNLKGDIIFKTPGIRGDIDELCKARKRGTLVTSEMEMFFKLCPCKTIGVTGSDGKTTTTTLIAKILTEDGKVCHIGGNIGKPLLPEIDKISENDVVVVELSSFQLMSMKYSPDVAVITNIAPNHLDIHKSMEEYIEAKKNIFLNQNKSGVLVLNAKNDITASFAPEARGDVVFFGGDGSGVYFIDIS